MSKPEDMSEFEEMPRRERPRLYQFLITLSGARPDILALCPGERIRFQSIGWAILITSVMAVVSMWFALTTALGVHPYRRAPNRVAVGTSDHGYRPVAGHLAAS